MSADVVQLDEPTDSAAEGGAAQDQDKAQESDNKEPPQQEANTGAQQKTSKEESKPAKDNDKGHNDKYVTVGSDPEAFVNRHHELAQKHHAAAQKHEFWNGKTANWRI